MTPLSELNRLFPAIPKPDPLALNNMELDMPKFRKKPVLVDAILYRGAGSGGNLSEALSFTGKDPSWDEYFDSFASYEEYVLNDRHAFKIFTLEGTMEAMPGDWIIRGVKGEHYPCKPEIFAATYEPVDADETNHGICAQGLSCMDDGCTECGVVGCNGRCMEVP